MKVISIFKKIIIITMFSLMSFANAVETTLADYYSGNFIKDSYKVGVTISGMSYYWVPLQGRGEREYGDSFSLMNGKYSINVKFSRLTELGERGLIENYNKHCERMFFPCDITVIGDIGLSSDISGDMVLFLNARKVMFDDLDLEFK